MTDSGVTAHPNDLGITGEMMEAGMLVGMPQMGERDYVRIYLAMRKLDPALAIPNDEGMRELAKANNTLARMNGQHRDEWRAKAVRYAEALGAIMEVDGEINPSNYNHEDVCALNGSYVEMFQIAEAALAETPSPVEDDEMIERVVERICRDVCELPDRSSPEDEPDMVLVTLGELAEIARAAITATKGDA